MFSGLLKTKHCGIVICYIQIHFTTVFCIEGKKTDFEEWERVMSEERSHWQSLKEKYEALIEEKKVGLQKEYIQQIPEMLFQCSGGSRGENPYPSRA